MHVLVRVVPRIAWKPVFCGPRNVSGEDEAVPVDDGIEIGGGAEAFGVFDGPGGEDATAAAASDEEIVGVDVAFGDDGVHPAVEVGEIVARIGVMNEVGEFFAVAGAAAGIGVKDNVTHRSPALFFKVEAVAIIAEGAAVNFKDEWIFFRGIKIWRLNDPAFDFTIVF